MLFLSIIMMLASIVLYLTVVADMFRKKVWLGFLGLFLFPFTFYHAFVNYKGNRKKMGTALTLTTLLPLAYWEFEESAGGKELAPFFELTKENMDMECMMTSGLKSGGGITSYNVKCYPQNLSDVDYTSQKQLLTAYQAAFVDPAMEFYKATFGQIEDKGITLIIPSPSELSACYEIENPGMIVDSYTSFEECF